MIPTVFFCFLFWPRLSWRPVQNCKTSDEWPFRLILSSDILIERCCDRWVDADSISECSHTWPVISSKCRSVEILFVVCYVIYLALSDLFQALSYVIDVLRM